MNSRCYKIWLKAQKQGKYITCNYIALQPSAYLNTVNNLKKWYD